MIYIIIRSSPKFHKKIQLENRINWKNWYACAILTVEIGPFKRRIVLYKYIHIHMYLSWLFEIIQIKYVLIVSIYYHTYILVYILVHTNIHIMQINMCVCDYLTIYSIPQLSSLILFNAEKIKWTLLRDSLLNMLLVCFSEC